MNRRQNNPDGIQVYQTSAKSVSGRKKTNRSIFLWAARIIAVWFVMCMWLENLFSVFEMTVSKSWLFGILFVFSCVFTLMPGYLKKLPLLFSILAVLLVLSVCIWKNHALMADVINYAANAYLRLHFEGTKQIALYNDSLAAGPGLATGIAVLVLPFLILWILILYFQKGRAAAVLFMLLPMIFAAIEGYFPSASSCWMLILSAGVYFSVMSCDSGTAAWRRSFCSLVLLLLLILLSSVMSGWLEKGKKANSTLYKGVSSSINENIIDKFPKQVQELKNNFAKDTEQAQPPSVADTKEQAPDSQAEPATEQNSDSSANQGTDGYFTGEGLSNLKAVGSFTPSDEEVMTYMLWEPPKSTVYASLIYGGVYSDNAWQPADGQDQDLDIYREYPETLSRLISLCRKAAPKTLEETSAFIQKQFEENTVYDYQPGVTPSDKDFAEYFLFDNKKGFCVHFATTAVLMYRICGFLARYTEGYAIPASAFQEQEDGTYVASVTASMGHAWAEVYEEGTGWAVREHTLPYTGAKPITSGKPAASDSEAGFTDGMKILAISVSVCILGVIILFFLQAAIRRKNKYRIFRQTAKGNGIQYMYQNIYDIAVFRGMEKTEPLSSKTLAQLEKYCPEISQKDWNWMWELLMETLFYNRIPGKKENKRMYQIVLTFSKQAEKKLTKSAKFRFRYLLCLG